MNTPTPSSAAMLAAAAYTNPAHRSLPSPAVIARAGRLSPLVLADRLLTLAQDADQSGYAEAASSLVTLVYSVLDNAEHSVVAA